MYLKTLLVITIFSFSSLIASDLSDAERAQFKVKPIFILQTRAQKDIYDNGYDDNVDNFFGRVYFGTNISIKNFYSEVAIIAYPSGFGYELMRGIQTESDTVNSEVQPLLQKVAKFQVNSAFVKHSGKILELEIGRHVLVNTHAAFFGNYVDEGPGGYFTGKGVYGNFVKFDFMFPKAKTSLAIGSNDPKVNTGYLRFFQDITFLENGHIGLGFRTDVLNRVYDPDIVVYSNATAQIDYTINEKYRFFVEAGITDINSETDPLIPLLAGFQFRLPKVINGISFEVEYLNEDDRPTAGIEGDMKQLSPVLLGLSFIKEFNEHFRLLGGIFTEREISEMSVGLDLKIGLGNVGKY